MKEIKTVPFGGEDSPENAAGSECSFVESLMNGEEGRQIHPGMILCNSFLKPLDVSAYRLSKETFIPQTRISEIIKGNRRITADTALRFAIYFGNDPKYWLGLQDDYDIEVELKEKKEEFLMIRPLAS